MPRWTTTVQSLQPVRLIVQSEFLTSKMEHKIMSPILEGKELFQLEAVALERLIWNSVISTIAMKDQYGNWHGPIQDMVKFWLLARMTEKSSFGGRSTDPGLNCTFTLNTILRSILYSGHHTNMD